MSKGLVKAIGISNFTITKTERLLQTAKIVPAVNQVEYHPYLQQEKLKKYCNNRGKSAMSNTSIASYPGVQREGYEANTPKALLFFNDSEKRER